MGGHLVDHPGRVPPRFPQHRVEAVTAAMGAVLDEWEVGPGTTVICGGARGADLIGAGLALSRGAAVRLRLALPPAEFARRSVDLPGTDWHARFEEVRARSEVEVLPAGAAVGDEVFAQVNAWMAEEAYGLDERPRLIVVWDGKPGDGPGGTADLVAQLAGRDAEARIRIIHPDPTAL
ncbi:hypothetical protein GCM10009733_109730 [Nonomuraea maheshkhaliensis]|uniref:DUF1273 family protein n=1 Tax=Nonomuraea maheshkhaliensis TaxID=419590 RepID=A0ABP4U159_9ACTN